MNSFLLGNIAGLRQNIPESVTDPMSKLRESMSNRQCTFSLGAVGPDEVLKIIKNLKNSKSTVTDKIQERAVFNQLVS